MSFKIPFARWMLLGSHMSYIQGVFLSIYQASAQHHDVTHSQRYSTFANEMAVFLLSVN